MTSIALDCRSSNATGKLWPAVATRVNTIRVDHMKLGSSDKVNFGLEFQTRRLDYHATQDIQMIEREREYHRYLNRSLPYGVLHGYCTYPDIMRCLHIS
jgi:hypothetical protein